MLISSTLPQVLTMLADVSLISFGTVTIVMILGILGLVRGWSIVRQTTLRAAWGWIAFYLVLWGMTEVYAVCGNPAADRLVALRFATAVATFCPVVAMLGAKRPQNSAWQLIVAALWVILALPAAEVLVLRPGQTLASHDARGWFLWALIGMGVVNYFPTRYTVAAMLYGLGQALLLAPHLPLWRAESSESRQLWGGAAIAGSFIFAAIRSRVGVVTSPGENRVWLDFRNLYGVLWTMRVAERFSATAQSNGWKVRLNWLGFVSPIPIETADEVSPSSVATGDANTVVVSAEPTARQHLYSLLRRFVSAEWIESRSASSLVDSDR